MIIGRTNLYVSVVRRYTEYQIADLLFFFFFFLVIICWKGYACTVYVFLFWPNLRITLMGVVKKDAKCHFIILNSVLIPMNNVFVLMADVKIGCYFNNSIFFIKKYN